MNGNFSGRTIHPPPPPPRPEDADVGRHAAASALYPFRTPAETAAIKNAAELIKELLSDPRNVIVGRHAILLWNAETQLRAMLEAV